MASEPEWKSVPSPRFWNMCGVSVNGAMPTHCTPSPPMWVTPAVRRSGMVSAMPWQPMPAAAIEPSGTTVERLCGQPEQKYGWRDSVSAAGRSRSASSRATRAVIDSSCRRLSSRLATIWAMRSASSSPLAGTSGRPCSSRLPTTRGWSASL